jgi:hypothetical protein
MALRRDFAALAATQNKELNAALTFELTTMFPHRHKYWHSVERREWQDAYSYARYKERTEIAFSTPMGGSPRAFIGRAAGVDAAASTTDPAASTALAAVPPAPGHEI